MRTAEPAGPSSSPLKNAAALGALGVCVTSMLGMSVAHAADAVDDPDGDGDNDGKKVQQVTVKGVRSLLDDKLPGDQLDVPQSLTVVTEKLRPMPKGLICLLHSILASRLKKELSKTPGYSCIPHPGCSFSETLIFCGTNP